MRAIAALLFLLVPVPLLAQDLSVSRFAGAAEGYRDGSASTAGFSYPVGVAIAADGSLYVADSVNHVIRRVTTDGWVTTVAGSAGQPGHRDGPGNQSLFHFPNSVGTGPDGSVYVADTMNFVIRRIDVNGGVSTIAGVPNQPGFRDGAASTAIFGLPTGVAVGRDGTIYVADSAANRIRRISTDGRVSTIAGRAAAGHENGIGSGAMFAAPYAIALDGDRLLVIADSRNNLIRRLDLQTGQVLTVAGEPLTCGSRDGIGSRAKFCRPAGVAVDVSGNILVADADNHIIRRIDRLGTVVTIAGSAGLTGDTNGTGSEARFSSPLGIACDVSGAIFIGDMANHVIRRAGTEAPSPEPEPEAGRRRGVRRGF